MESNKWRGPNKCVGATMFQFLVEQLFIDDDTMLGFDGPWRPTFRYLSMVCLVSSFPNNKVYVIETELYSPNHQRIRWRLGHGMETCTRNSLWPTRCLGFCFIAKERGSSTWQLRHRMTRIILVEFVITLYVLMNKDKLRLCCCKSFNA